MPASAAEGGYTTSIDTSGSTLSSKMTLDANLMLTAALPGVPVGMLLLPSYHPCALSIVRAGSLPRLLRVYS